MVIEDLATVERLEPTKLATWLAARFLLLWYTCLRAGLIAAQPFPVVREDSCDPPTLVLYALCAHGCALMAVCGNGSQSEPCCSLNSSCMPVHRVRTMLNQVYHLMVGCMPLSDASAVVSKRSARPQQLACSRTALLLVAPLLLAVKHQLLGRSVNPIRAPYALCWEPSQVLVSTSWGMGHQLPVHLTAACV